MHLRERLIPLLCVGLIAACGDDEEPAGGDVTPDTSGPSDTSPDVTPDSADPTDTTEPVDTAEEDTDTVADPCADEPCGAGLCGDDGQGGYTCECPGGTFFDGATCAACEALERCAETSCTGPDDATCEACDEGYAFDDQGVCVPAAVDACAGDPCGQDVCVDNGDGTYSCTPAVTGCGDISPNGTCTADDEVQWCIVPPAGVVINLQAASSCLDGEECRTIDGISRCYPVPSTTECSRRMAFCDGDTLVSCDEAGPMTRTACDDGCVSRQQGAYCETGISSTVYEATVTYDYRLPNADRSDWEETPRAAPLRGAMVMSWRKVGEDWEIFDTALTDHEGHFAVRIPDPGSAEDVVTVYAARNRPLSATWGFVVAEPDMPDGEQEGGAIAQGNPYRWDIYPAETASGETVHINEAQGAGALRVFDVMSIIYENTAELFYRDVEPMSVVVWLRLNTTWQCGECHWVNPTDALGTTIESQMFISGDVVDSEFFADAVTLHEAGHWVMGAFGRSPGEGGPHNVGVAYYPGLAWSEGFATWLSADWRDDSVYLDKAGGSMWWIDIEARSGSLDAPWPRPTPEDGVMGRLYENEVSSMLWRLSTNPEVTSNEIYAALGSSRGKEPLRGYTRHNWEIDEYGEPINVEDTGEPAVMFADVLDALVCESAVDGIADHIDAATEPDTYYAYPSASPICE